MDLNPPRTAYIIVPEFGDTIYLNYGATIKAKAFQNSPTVGRAFESGSTSHTYVSSTPKVEIPIINPGGGNYSQPHQVTMSTNTPGATIRYRTDGRAPSFFYPGTVYDGPVTLSPGMYEINARAYKDGFYKSDTARSGEIVVTQLTLPSPTIYPNGGQFNGQVTIYMGSTVLGATIRYSFDGEPNENSPIFSEPITVEAGETTILKSVRAEST